MRWTEVGQEVELAIFLHFRRQTVDKERAAGGADEWRRNQHLRLGALKQVAQRIVPSALYRRI
jgi:hypothetical protein